MKTDWVRYICNGLALRSTRTAKKRGDHGGIHVVGMILLGGRSVTTIRVSVVVERHLALGSHAAAEAADPVNVDVVARHALRRLERQTSKWLIKRSILSTKTY